MFPPRIHSSKLTHGKRPFRLQKRIQGPSKKKGDTEGRRAVKLEPNAKRPKRITDPDLSHGFFSPSPLSHGITTCRAECEKIQLGNWYCYNRRPDRDTVEMFYLIFPARLVGDLMWCDVASHVSKPKPVCDAKKQNIMSSATSVFGRLSMLSNRPVLALLEKSHVAPKKQCDPKPR